MSALSARLAFALRFARRDLRSGLAGFRIFLASLTLGVAAIAVLIAFAVTVPAQALTGRLTPDVFALAVGFGALLLIGGGSNELQHLIIARQLLERYAIS